MDALTATPAADVVTVPDFAGPAAPRFEALALLFLAAWAAHGGRSRLWPLHLACIGEPPPSVRRLAERTGARITVHAPLPLLPGRTSNKLRGFEVTAATGRVLLLDTDTMVLDDLGPLVDVVGWGIGLGAASVNHFPETTWKRIFAAAGVPYPGPTGTCWCADPRLAAARGLTAEQQDLCARTPPYFNSGVVLAPAGLGLDRLWAAHLRAVRPLFEGLAPLAAWAGGADGDEHALATAVEHCRLRGTRVVTIPWRYHARPLLLRAGVLAWEDVALFHYHRTLKPYVLAAEDLLRLGAVVPVEQREGLPGFYAAVEALVRDRIVPVLPGVRGS